MQLEIDNRMKTGNLWITGNYAALLNNQWVKEGVTETLESILRRMKVNEHKQKCTGNSESHAQKEIYSCIYLC